MNTISKYSAFKAVVIVALFSVLTRVLGFLFRIYLSRELGAEMLGVYQVAFSVFMVLVVVVSSGLPLTVSKMTARYQVKNDNKGKYGVVSSSLIIGLLVSIFICGIFVVFQNQISHMFTDVRTMGILCTLLPAVIFSAVYSSFRGSLWGTKNYFFVSMAEFVEQIARILVFVLFANFLLSKTNLGVVAGISMTVGCLISMLFVAIVYFCDKRKLSSPKGYYKQVFKSSLPITGVRTATSLIQPLIAVLFPIMLVVSGHTNEEAMSLYGVVMGMAFPLLFLPSTIVGAMSFTLIPDLSVSIAQKNTSEVAQKIRSNVFFATLISVVFIPFFVGAGPQICEFLYNNSTAGVYLQKSAIVMLPLGLSNITSSILNTFNLEVKSFINNIVGGVLLILCVVVLSGVLTVDALILGFLLCMSVTTIMNIFMIKRHTKLALNLTLPLVLMLVFVVPSALLCNFLCQLLAPVVGLFVALFLSGCASVVAFVVLCWAFNILDVVSLFCKFLPKKRTKMHKI